MTCILAEFEVDSREVVVYKLVACCVGGLDRLRVAGSSDGACVCFFFGGKRCMFEILRNYQCDRVIRSYEVSSQHVCYSSTCVLLCCTLLMLAQQPGKNNNQSLSLLYLVNLHATCLWTEVVCIVWHA